MPSALSPTKILAVQLKQTLYEECNVDEDEATVGMEAQKVFYKSGYHNVRYRNHSMSVNWHYGKRAEVRKLSGLSPDRAVQKYSHIAKKTNVKVTAKRVSGAIGLEENQTS